MQTVNKTGRKADKILKDIQGNSYEAFSIPGYPRYWLLRCRQGNWAVHDRLKQRAVKKIMREGGLAYRMRSPGRSKPKYEYLHRLIMLALEPEGEQRFVKHLNDNLLDNRLENLSWWDGYTCFTVKHVDGTTYKGSIREIRKQAKIGIQKAVKLAKGEYVPDWQLIGKELERSA